MKSQQLCKDTVLWSWRLVSRSTLTSSTALQTNATKVGLLRLEAVSLELEERIKDAPDTAELRPSTQQIVRTFIDLVHRNVRRPMESQARIDKRRLARIEIELGNQVNQMKSFREVRLSSDARKTVHEAIELIEGIPKRSDGGSGSLNNRTAAELMRIKSMYQSATPSAKGIEERKHLLREAIQEFEQVFKANRSQLGVDPVCVMLEGAVQIACKVDLMPALANTHGEFVKNLLLDLLHIVPNVDREDLALLFYKFGLIGPQLGRLRAFKTEMKKLMGALVTRAHNLNKDLSPNDITLCVRSLSVNQFSKCFFLLKDFLGKIISNRESFSLQQIVSIIFGMTNLGLRVADEMDQVLGGERFSAEQLTARDISNLIKTLDMISYKRNDHDHYLRSCALRIEQLEEKLQEKESSTILNCLASMDYHPGVAALDTLARSICNSEPKDRLYFDRALKALKSLSILKHPHDQFVKIVQDDFVRNHGLYRLDKAVQLVLYLCRLDRADAETRETLSFVLQVPREGERSSALSTSLNEIREYFTAKFDDNSQTSHFLSIERG